MRWRQEAGTLHTGVVAGDSPRGKQCSSEPPVGSLPGPGGPLHRRGGRGSEGAPGARAGGTLGRGRAGRGGNPRNTEWRGPPCEGLTGGRHARRRPRCRRCHTRQCPIVQAAPWSVPPEPTRSNFPETSKLPESTLELGSDVAARLIACGTPIPWPGLRSPCARACRCPGPPAEGGRPQGPP